MCTDIHGYGSIADENEALPKTPLPLRIKSAREKLQTTSDFVNWLAAQCI